MNNWYKTAQDYDRATPEELFNELGRTVEGQGYAIIGRSGPQTVCYCDSSTQGIKMLPISEHSDGYSAKIFTFKRDAEIRLEVLKGIFLGITDWSIEPTLL